MRNLLIGAAAAAGCLLATLTPDNSRTAWSVPAAPVDDVQPVEKSMHEFMEYVFQPAYLRLKAAMATAPADNKGWKAIKADSLVLAESCNLLFGRAPDGGAADWISHAKAAREKGGALYAAGKAKDFTAASTAWKSMLESCNACHKQFEDGKHILQP